MVRGEKVGEEGMVSVCVGKRGIGECVGMDCRVINMDMNWCGESEGEVDECWL